MTLDDDHVARHDRIADVTRHALSRLAGEAHTSSLAWPAVEATARHVKLVRRLVAGAVCGLLVLAATAGAVAAASRDHRRGMSVSGNGDATEATATTTTSTESSRTTTEPPTNSTVGGVAPAGKTANGSCTTCSEISPPTTGTEGPPQSPEAGDFTGSITVRGPIPTNTPPCDGCGVPYDVEWHFRNMTDHAIDPSGGTPPHGLGLVCAGDLSADGQTSETLVQDVNFEFVTNAPIRPGDEQGSGPWFLTFTHTVTCEGVITRVAPGTTSLVVVGRITNIEPVTITIPPSLATTSTSVGDTTTTVPTP
jgi:hypothetical protein